MNRLELIASLTKGSKTIADIGCDHGYVVIDSIKKYQISHAYACDINLLPLQNAKKNVINAKLSDRVSFIQTNGMNDLNELVDCIIISGMGGQLIKQIILNDLPKAKTAKKLILQANNEMFELRSFLDDYGFEIISEHNVLDKKHYYEILVCKYSEIKGQLRLEDRMFGPFLRREKNSLFINNYQKKLDILKYNLSRVKEDKSKIELEKKIKEIEKVIEE